MNEILLREQIKGFLNEDIGTGDLSANLIFDREARGKGGFTAKTDGIVCGLFLIKTVYEVYGDYDASVRLYFKDGDRVKKGELLAESEGSVITLLSCERIILNLMQRLSGIATISRTLVDNLNDPSIKVVDTRKTLPGLRMLDKYAVICGGAYNHRMGLYDGVMLKDNHIAFAGGIREAVKKAKDSLGHTVKVEVETETAAQVKEAAAAGADIIMFDNRTPEEVKELVKLVPENIITEVSGGITPETIGKFRGCGAHIISTGFMTHTVTPMDISFNTIGGGKL
ncbi:MAG: carboxylating nicotinate-nucleotide diphosphorylase [Clostridiales bacterium]|nr:carboxylating nicotinate-nucleotide diphosphorylase [Clostridiales bacterium]